MSTTGHPPATPPDLENLQRQLELLRRKIAKIDAKYAEATPASRLPDGYEVETEFGKHWEIDRHWPAHHRHGTADVGALSELKDDLLCALGGDEPVCSPVGKWVFLDTETTGLAGGSGTLAFLIGVGFITADGFVLKQFFVRDHGEEKSALSALESWLDGFEVLVTFNGKTYDIPLLETRYTMNRRRSPFPRFKHVDLLHSSRRLWKLALESCRLQELESRVLGVERHGDVGGQFIPNLYFEYLRSKDARPLLPVLSHNAVDILSLACLTAVVPEAFQAPSERKNAAEMVGLARWLRNQGRMEEAWELMETALSRRLEEALLYETLWHTAELARKLGKVEAAVARWCELSTVRNQWQVQALEKLAIHYERREKNRAMALEMTQAAIRLEPSDELRKREARLLAHLQSKPPKLLG